MEEDTAEPTGGRSRKRELDEDDDDGGTAIKEPRLTQREVMQLRLLASVPALSGPLRDARGRRRAVSLTSSDLINAGLSSIVAGAAVADAEPEEAQTEDIEVHVDADSTRTSSQRPSADHEASGSAG